MFIVENLKKKIVKKKKKPFSGVLVSQMLAAREAEKQRIVEVGSLHHEIFIIDTNPNFR